MNTIDLTPIFQAVIMLLAALITHRLIPWLKARTTKQQQENIQAAAKIAVFAAEQIFGAGQGEDKLDYALGVLERAGYHVDKTIAREAIEKAVAEMNWEYVDITEDTDANSDDDSGDAPDTEQSHPPEGDE